MNLVGMLKRMEKMTADNSPAILTALGVAGTITTAYLTGKATLIADELIKTEKKLLKYQDLQHPYERKDSWRVVKKNWIVFLPAATSGAFTITCIVGANRIGNRRAAAMALAYSISERAFDEYKDKVVEKFGTAKEQKIRDEVAQERVKKHPASSATVIITGGGDVLCFDHFSGRYFQSDMQTLKKAQNEINWKILHSSYASLSDFYNAIGLSATSFSEEVGWNSDCQLDLLFSTTISDDERPCLAIDFNISPVRNYHLCFEGP